MNDRLKTLLRNTRNFGACHWSLEDQNFLVSTAGTQEFRFFKVGHPKDVRLMQSFGNGQQAMAIGVGLDDGHKFAAPCMCSGNGEVVCESFAIDAGLNPNHSCYSCCQGAGPLPGIGM